MVKEDKQKQFQQNTKYAEYDLDGDGVITDEEIQKEKEMAELERIEEKAEAQKRMSWIALSSMIIFTIFLYLPIIPDSRVQALGDLLGLFYIGQASIVGFYFGAQAYMSRK